MGFYEYSAKSITGDEISMQSYEGKVVLIVNTASKCGFTKQYAGLEDLYEEYRQRGLEILGFPCNQFAGQDPGTNAEIEEFCRIKFGVSFTMFEKIKVNGKEAHPLYQFLKGEQKGMLGARIKWNFTKFLVDREGKVVSRFAPQVTPEKLRNEIEKLL